MYAFLNMPDYAPLQFHPFTISSGPHDNHLEFIIAGMGDWTQSLVQQCLLAQREMCTLPVFWLDGPYLAPATAALRNKSIVAVGAGKMTNCLSPLSLYG